MSGLGHCGKPARKARWGKVRVLVTGSEGYVGSVLRDVLMEYGHDCVGLDTGYFNDGDLGRAPRPIPLISKDIREVTHDDVADFDAVIHLAALANDALGALDESLTHTINTDASLRLAELAKAAGVHRFVFSSSCSMYGRGGARVLAEDAPLEPLTAYAHSKRDVEVGLSKLADDAFSPVYLRNATAFGLAPRFRFDLVVNNLVGWAWTTKCIRMTSDGTPWRPLVHVRDIARACVCALEAPAEAVHDQAFNIGSNDHNLQIRDIADRIQRHFPECEVTFGRSDGDARTYSVDFAKANASLPGFERTAFSLDEAVAELKEVFDNMALRQEDFESRLYARLKQIQHLRAAGRLDSKLYWTDR